MIDYDNPTSDLARFGYRELAMAATLLKEYAQHPPEWLGENVRVWMNTHSGNVFLSDEDFNVGMMNGEKLEQFHSCPECGHEGFLEEMEHNPKNDECQEYLKQIKEVNA